MTLPTTSKYATLHLKPKGPGNSRPTAMQIVSDEQRVGDLHGKVALITGCSSGLGVETARAMKATGITVFVTARNPEKARESLGDILDGKQVHLLRLDLESLDSVRACAAEFKSKSETLNVLIENAGIRNVRYGKTNDGFEKHWGAEFQSRVVIVSSTAHRNGPMNFNDLNWEKRRYEGLMAYGQSKLANVYTANEIERRYGSHGLHAWSVHPGGIRTGLQTPSLRDAMMVSR